MTLVPDRPWALVLEDDPVVTAVLEKCLARLGWHALSVNKWSDGQEVLRHDECSLMIADHGLSATFTGAAAIEWVRKNHPTVRCVLISGAACPAAFQEEPPHRVFLDKPFGPEELKATLLRIGLHCGKPLPRESRIRRARV